MKSGGALAAKIIDIDRQHPTFKIVDLTPYLGEEDELESRMTQMQEGEDDEDIYTNDTSTPMPPPLGPITRAHARQINHQVSSFLTSCPLYLDNGNTHTFVVLRNDREDKKGRRFVWARLG